MKILHLTLKQQWFDLIDSDEKKEEYRQLKPYWIKRLLSYPKALGNPDLVAEQISYDLLSATHNSEQVLKAFQAKVNQFDGVLFKLGYAKNAKSIYFASVSITIGTGNAAWGAPAEKVFILKLNKRSEPPTRTPQPKHKFKRLRGVQYTVMARCEYCGLEREGVKGEYTYLTKTLSSYSGRFHTSYSESAPPCKNKKKEVTDTVL